LAIVTQRPREGSVLPSRQLRTTPSENPQRRAISLTLPDILMTARTRLANEEGATVASG